MFRRVSLVLLFAVLVIVSADINKTLIFEKPHVVDGVVVMNGCRSARQGFAPKVAVKPVLLALPIGREAQSFTVSYNGLTELEGEYDVQPYIPGFDMSTEPNPFIRNVRSAAYETNAFLPEAKRSGWFTTQYKNGIPVFVTCVNPVQYNAVTGKIRYYENIEVTVQTQPAKRSNTHASSTRFAKSMLQHHVDNKEVVSAIPEVQKDADDYEYLIITYDGLKDHWGDFVEFNKRRAMRTKIQTIQYISSNVSGSDLQDKVRNYIKEQYENHRIVYVNLGGDVSSNANSIPYRRFHARFYDHDMTPERFHQEPNLKADMYFATLDGDWKGGNQTYGLPGTEDVFWEVYGGRFSADNETELANMINKTIMYSEQPVVDEVMNLFLAGNFMWDSYGIDVNGGDYVEEFLGICSNNGYTTHGWNINDWSIERLYDKNSLWSVGDFRSIVHTHKPTWIDHMGHGNVTYNFNETNPGVTNTNYQNNGVNANFFVIVTSACYPGNFVYNDCLLEQFVKISNGAVACIGCSNSSWGDNDGTDGSTQRPFRYMHDAIANPDRRIHHLEMMHASGKEDQSEILLNTTISTPPYFGCIHFCIYETNVLGDPALSIWTKRPKTFTKLPEFLANPHKFKMKTPPYSWVALCDEDGTIITTQLTGYMYDKDSSFSVRDSSCLILDAPYQEYVANNPGKKLKVRIKAHNYLPYEEDVDISTSISSSNSGFNMANYEIKTFDRHVRVHFTLTTEDLVTVSVYNSKGTLMQRVVNSGKNSTGEHSINISTKNFSSGIYYCKLNTGNDQAVRKFYIAH